MYAMLKRFAHPGVCHPNGEGSLEMSLKEIRVLDFSDQIAGPYCSKLLSDAGAQVIKVEGVGGDSLRGEGSGPGGSPLFRFLNAGKQSLVGTVTDPRVRSLLAQADLVIEAHGLESDQGQRLDVEALRRTHPALVVLSLTPYGLTGPWAQRKATEFTLQAESGSIALRGLMGEEPYQAGGRLTEWAAGSYGAVAALPAIFRARDTGQGEHIDLSMLETANTIFTNFSESMNRLMNAGAEDPPNAFLAQSVETPSIEPTADGYVGFCTNSRQQFSDFLLMIDRVDLQEDEQLAQFAGRLMRFEEWNAIIHAWLSTHTTAEVIEKASLLRIPVAPIGNGQTVLSHPHLAERGAFIPDATGDFMQPRIPYRIDHADPPRPGFAPDLGAHTASACFAPRAEKTEKTPAQSNHGAQTQQGGRDPALPLEGLRVLDLTAWWAGPSASHILASLGAEVIHVEAAGRPDGMRMVGGMMAGHYPDWWEASPHFLQANSNKLGVTLDLNTDKGHALLEGLIKKSDAVVENYTPRVLDNFGLTWERIRALNPRATMMRMPAFGLSGPWRDNTGFAQTMEQLSGLAWLTGHSHDQPRIPRGPCDPIAGMHAAFAFLVTQADRHEEGHQARHVESTMVESALNVAAEQIVRFSAHGEVMERDGNRSPLAAPQGLYPCAGSTPGAESWLALSVASDRQWLALRSLLGEPHWSLASNLETLPGRRLAHDAIDEELRNWTRVHERDTLIADLRKRGIPASEVANPCRLYANNPQFESRGYFERPQHPTVGPLPLPSLPFRYASIERWLQKPAPTLGQHNQAVLGNLLGLSSAELAELETEGVIGTRPQGL